jgi:hypothetical protein
VDAAHDTALGLAQAHLSHGEECVPDRLGEGGVQERRDEEAAVVTVDVRGEHIRAGDAEFTGLHRPTSLDKTAFRDINCSSVF